MGRRPPIRTEPANNFDQNSSSFGLLHYDLNDQNIDYHNPSEKKSQIYQDDLGNSNLKELMQDWEK